jgi:hypothetical protein
MEIAAPQQEQLTRAKEEEKRSKSTSRRQTPLEAAQKTATTTLAREGVKLLGKLASGLLTAFFKKK